MVRSEQFGHPGPLGCVCSRAAFPVTLESRRRKLSYCFHLESFFSPMVCFALPTCAANQMPADGTSNTFSHRIMETRNAPNMPIGSGCASILRLGKSLSPRPTACGLPHSPGEASPNPSQPRQTHPGEYPRSACPTTIQIRRTPSKSVTSSVTCGRGFAPPARVSPSFGCACQPG